MSRLSSLSLSSPALRSKRSELTLGCERQRNKVTRSVVVEFACRGSAFSEMPGFCSPTGTTTARWQCLTASARGLRIFLVIVYRSQSRSQTVSRDVSEAAAPALLIVAAVERFLRQVEGLKTWY